MKTNSLLILALCVGCWVGSGAQNAPAAGETNLLDFTRSQRARRYTQVPREVLAFYYTWYGRPERHGQWVH